ncbi:transposase [Flaviflagellibacter deserti]|uniref:Transposase n=1 Tax=Flaviflagellibacter deserti TaxID=2267266 RepID=A0ABV9Z4B0_9HYPH
MRRSGHTDDEITFLLAEADAGIPIDDICRAAHVSLRTFYRWRKRFGGLDRPAVERLTSLEDENRRLRRQLDYLMRLREHGSHHPSRDGAAHCRMEVGVGWSKDHALANGAPPPALKEGVALGRFSTLRTGR